MNKNRKIGNMTRVKIVTDSSVTIEPEVIKEFDITVVPLSVMIDSVLYSDADLEEGEFLRLMLASKNLPKTSQPPVGVFAEIFETLGETADKIISIHMSHALSGTVEAARQGATLANVDVTVIDSSFTDQALKFQVVEAAKLAKEIIENNKNIITYNFENLFISTPLFNLIILLYTKSKILPNLVFITF